MAGRMKLAIRTAMLILGGVITATAGLPGTAMAQTAQPFQTTTSQAIDSDLVRPTAPAAATPYAPRYSPAAPAPTMAYAQTEPPRATTRTRDATYQSDGLIGAAEGAFGKGAHGLAQLIQDILKKQGEPNAYIVGREAGGAFAVGLRYGSGTLTHKIEGKRPVYWTGPSIGFDAGANAATTFVLVYNLYNTDDLYKRFGAGEGQAYLVGGFNVSYLRRGNVVLIPVRMGVGMRLGINGGYMKLSKKQTWLPF